MAVEARGSHEEQRGSLIRPRAGGRRLDPPGASAVLVEASASGDVGGVQRILKESLVDINASDLGSASRLTPLAAASRGGRLEVVKSLIGEKEVEVNR